GWWNWNKPSVWAEPRAWARACRRGRRPRAWIRRRGRSEHVRIDHVLTDRLTIEHTQDIARRLLAHAVDRLARHAGHMRRHDHVGQGMQRVADRGRLLLEHVEAGAGDAARDQRIV